ncbi:imelysin family protein [Pseudoprimorskyibacter insulae]|uniref:Imelysin-like domain-containing protein n=1 Tax=Pseudoprimorskyibacter insulae TaxID=1695997 RepID=A0A2R8AUK4_9RHOB|nr:imelysin family protein [Pseudoprimorskyibacter insulae]SPF79587.1 hypothetical protein PRI8871_01384 [Pseudoprimorskyibacter insulae]
MLRALLLCLLPATAFAGVDEVIDQHILPGYDRFAAETNALADAAASTCDMAALAPAYGAAFDAWMGISHIQFGPIEEDGRVVAIAFWPDPKNRVGKALSRLIADADPIIDTAEGFAEVSAAAHGLFALERLLFDPQDNPDYACALTRAAARALADSADEMVAEWPAFADQMRTAGAPGNMRFLSNQEVLGAIYTSLMTGLEFTKDQRLGRPLGTFDRPRPTMAEARRSGRSLRNVVLSLEATRDLAFALSAQPAPDTALAYDQALEMANALEDPTFEGVADVSGRFRVEVLQHQVQTVVSVISDEIGLPMGLSAGFNALDGD